MEIASAFILISLLGGTGHFLNVKWQESHREEFKQELRALLKDDDKFFKHLFKMEHLLTDPEVVDLTYQKFTAVSAQHGHNALQKYSDFFSGLGSMDATGNIDVLVHTCLFRALKEVHSLQHNAQQLDLARQELASVKDARTRLEQEILENPLVKVLELNANELEHIDKPEQKTEILDKKIQEMLTFWSLFKQSLPPGARQLPPPTSTDNPFEQYVGTVPKDILMLHDQLQNREKYEKKNIKLPRGILFEGPPGTGKTYLAQLLAQSLGHGFFHAKASEFILEFVGVGPNSVKQFFDKGRKFIASNPGKGAILFLDEIDGLANRDKDHNQEFQNTVNTFLSEMQGFESNNSIVVIGTTNHVRKLDAALRQRFNKLIHFSLPTMSEREKLFKFFADRKPDCINVNLPLEQFAQMTDGFSNREIEDLVETSCQEAAFEDNKLSMQEYILKQINETRKKHAIESSSTTFSIIQPVPLAIMLQQQATEQLKMIYLLHQIDSAQLTAVIEMAIEYAKGENAAHLQERHVSAAILEWKRNQFNNNNARLSHLSHIQHNKSES